MTLHRVLFFLYALILTVLYGAVFSTQVLAFFGLYGLVPVLLLTPIVSLAAFFVYFRYAGTWLQNPEPAHQSTNSFSMALTGGGLFLLITVFLVRMVLWPSSSIAAIIPDDAIDYHFIKVFELAQSGTMWDVGIVYGQYASGYESLIALSVLAGQGVTLTGLVHAILHVLLVLTVYLLLRRYTYLPSALLFFVSVVMFFFPPLYSQVLQVGKNDLFVSATVLGAILHAPAGWHKKDTAWHPYGLAFVTMLSLSIKSTGLLILVFLWLVVLVGWLQAFRQGKGLQYLHPVKVIVLAFIMIPGVLWVLRNYVMMGMLFSPEVSSFFQGSVLANLTNPALYTSGNLSLVFIISNVLVVGLGLLLLGFRRYLLAAVFFVVWLSFFITPLGAFDPPDFTVLNLELRFVTHELILGLLLLIVMLSSLISWLLRFIEASSLRVRGGGTDTCCCLCGNTPRYRLRKSFWHISGVCPANN